MELRALLNEIVSDAKMHARWLNTLSMMENEGSRKISACEDKINVSISVLKHAAEEARHAYFLKTQIKKLAPLEEFETYNLDKLFAPIQSYQYLNRLDSNISRYLKELGYADEDLRYGSYLLTTFAIEERADELYPVYAEALNAAGSNITVKLIIAEEIGHLEEMHKQMAAFFHDWKVHANYVRSLEKELYKSWITALVDELQFHKAAL